MDSYTLYWNGDYWSSHSTLAHAKDAIKELLNEYRDGFNTVSIRKDFDSSTEDEITWDVVINGVKSDMDFFTIIKETINV